jgi:cytochrome P450/ferredoxin-NADP reductase
MTRVVDEPRVGVANQAAIEGFDDFAVFDLSLPDMTTQANQRLATLREKSAVCQVQPLGALGVLRWSDCDQVLRTPADYSSAFRRSDPVPGAEAETNYDTLLWQDPPEHTRVRRLVQQAFTPQRVAAMEPHVRQITRELLEHIFTAGDSCDFHRDFAQPLPSYIMSMLLGVDRSMMDTFNRWAKSTFHGPREASQLEDPAMRARAMADIARDAHEMEDYLKTLVAHARSSPSQTLTSYVVHAQESDGLLTEREVLTLLKLFVIAGNDITTMALELTAYALASHPDQMQLLANDVSMAANTFEETLRFLGPALILSRLTTRDVTIAGTSLPAGTLVCPVVASANHDATVFDNPEVFDIKRTIPRVLSMGAGVHQCLGQFLARLEGRVAFEEWFAHVSELHLTAEPEFLHAMGVRGFQKLPLSFVPRPRPASVVAVGDSGVHAVATAERIARKSDAELGLDKRALRTVRVAAVRELSPTVRLFKLIHPSGGLLERFTPGSHIIVHMRDGDEVHRNAYSLLNSGYGDGLAYFIAVQRADPSRGGSIFMHERVKPGSELTISVPANTFPLVESAPKHLLIAGGIGVTPMIAFRYALKLRGQQHELHYAFRTAQNAAFVPELQMENDQHDVLYDSSVGHRLDLSSLLCRQPAGTQLYVCGPECLMMEAIDLAEGQGWPSEAIHFERFGAPDTRGAVAFDLIAQRSERKLRVAGTESALECLEHAGIAIESACRAGSCGSCETRVANGKPIYRNSVMSAAERDAGDRMMVCVDRAVDPITLDI